MHTFCFLWIIERTVMNKISRAHCFGLMLTGRAGTMKVWTDNRDSSQTCRYLAELNCGRYDEYFGSFRGILTKLHTGWVFPNLISQSSANAYKRQNKTGEVGYMDWQAGERWVDYSIYKSKWCFCKKLIRTDAAKYLILDTQLTKVVRNELRTQKNSEGPNPIIQMCVC